MSLRTIAELLAKAPVLFKRFSKHRWWLVTFLLSTGIGTNDVTFYLKTWTGYNFKIWSLWIVSFMDVNCMVIMSYS